MLVGSKLACWITECLNHKAVSLQTRQIFSCKLVNIRSDRERCVFYKTQILEVSNSTRTKSCFFNWKHICNIVVDKNHRNINAQHIKGLQTRRQMKKDQDLALNKMPKIIAVVHLWFHTFPANNTGIHWSKLGTTQPTRTYHQQIAATTTCTFSRYFFRFFAPIQIS